MPVLLSSGYSADRSLVDKARQRGGEFLQKPYSLESLYQTVHGVLRRGETSEAAADDVALAR